MTVPAERGTDELSLGDAAGLLQVHYMTAYRYVRNGRLPARKVGSEWRVRRADVDALRSPAVPGRGRRSRDPSRLEARLIAGDEAGAWGVVEQAMVAGAAPTDVLLDLIAPAMRRLGDRWERGEVTVADEHRASTVVHRLLGRLGPRFARRGRKRGVVVLGAAPGDRHGIPVAILADLLRAEGFEVVDLGADTPVQSFVDTVGTVDRLIAVGVSVTCTDALPAVPAVVAALHDASPGTPVLVGGRAVPDAGAAAETGADRWAADGPGAVDVVEELADARRRPDG